jgi:hypothetical protein
MTEALRYTDRDTPASFAKEVMVHGCAGFRCISLRDLPTSESRAPANQPDAVSWYRPHLVTRLALVEQAVCWLLCSGH